MFTITDEVEMGHSKFTGGTVVISLSFDEIKTDIDIKNILSIIDYLDHCLVTDNEDYLKYTTRYFYIENSENIFIDIVGIISNFITDFKEIKIQIGKLSYTSIHNPINILSYNKEG